MEQIATLRQEAEANIRSTASMQDLEQVRVRYLGKKGEVTSLLRGMKDIAPEERPAFGQKVNELRDLIEGLLSNRANELQREELAKRLAAEAIDVTIPGWKPPLGRKHPLTQTIDDIKEIFIGMGFEVVSGPEVETDYYNFEALNLPKDHPAREMQDTFFLAEELLLRSQTSPVQIRTMEKRKPPVRIIAPGKVYRRDSDVTHSPMFHQIEGLLVDEEVSMGDLKGVLTEFVHAMFGTDRKVRFRPSFFPFTEPSAEMDISCAICKGQGCRLCKGTGWIEILGSGMVHPRVLEMVDYDPERVRGFAFGMGVERIALLRYGFEDIRMLFENDVRFLEQF